MNIISKINPVVKYSWSRSHCNQYNYLTIEQTAYICMANTVCSVKGGKIVKILTENYEIAPILERKQEDDIRLRNHMICESIVDNVATQSYKHFRIIFANGKELIVNNYNEFLEAVKAYDEKFKDVDLIKA